MSQNIIDKRSKSVLNMPVRSVSQMVWLATNQPKNEKIQKDSIISNETDP